MPSNEDIASYESIPIKIISTPAVISQAGKTVSLLPLPNVDPLAVQAMDLAVTSVNYRANMRWTREAFPSHRGSETTCACAMTERLFRFAGSPLSLRWFRLFAASTITSPIPDVWRSWSRRCTPTANTLMIQISIRELDRYVVARFRAHIAEQV